MAGKYEQALKRASEGNANGKADADDKPSMQPVELPPLPIDAYFDNFSGGFYALNAHREYQRYDQNLFKLLLRRNGVSPYLRDIQGLSHLEGTILRIASEKPVSFAGPLGGHAPGTYDIHGSRVLVTTGPRFLEPRRGKWDTLREFFDTLFGDDGRYFYAWLKVAVTTLRDGPPWRPGQMLSIAGPPGCGKSVCQSLITPLLGGRVSSPYAYLSSSTNFNAEIYGAEHGLIGDVTSSVDPRARRNFGAAVKKLVAEPIHYVRGMYKAPVSLTPFLRLTISLNDDPQALHVLPPLDSDVKDKIMLLRARPADLAARKKRFKTWSACYRQMIDELPALLHGLLRWEIPKAIRDERYGVVSYHDPELIAKLQELSEEQKLLDVIDTYIFDKIGPDHWSGKAVELEKILSEKMRPGESARLFRYTSHCGGLLAKLAKIEKDRITIEAGKGKVQIYMIRRG